MRKSAPLYDPRIPRGCDQQGRHPEAAEACTEIGHKDEEWSWVFLIVYLTLAASIAAVLLIGV